MGKKTVIEAGTIDEMAERLKSVTPRDPAPGVTIKKATIKDGLFLAVKFEENTPSGTNSVSKDCTAPIHDDLRKAFQGLDEHLAEICHQYNETGAIDTENISCNGVAFGGGNGDSGGVTLIGSRHLDDGNVVNLTSPFKKYSDGYSGMAELNELTDTASAKSNYTCSKASRNHRNNNPCLKANNKLKGSFNHGKESDLGGH
jgi:hypothetical protein